MTDGMEPAASELHRDMSNQDTLERNKVNVVASY